ncbi:MAG: cell division protein FtsK [Planctomycetia bacterium]|nr:cell division protein FtsK [Planctomycetia bacterium]
MSTTPDHAAVHAADPLAREARFLAELRQLAAERAAEEARIESQYQAASKTALRGFEESRQSIFAQLEIERSDLASDYDEQRRHAASRFEIETSAIEGEFAQVRQEIAQEFESKAQRAERKLKEACWEAETLYEASKDVAPNQLKEVEQKLDTWLELVRIEREEAHALLTLWRQPSSDVVPQGESLAIVTGDLPARLQERVNFVTAQRAELSRLRVPPLVASWALVWVYALAGLLLAAVVEVIGLGLAGAAAALLATAAIGAGVSFYLRKLAGLHIEEIYPPLRQATREAEALVQRVLDDARSRAAAQQAEIRGRCDRALRAAEVKYQDRVAKMNLRRDTRLREADSNYPRRLAEIADRRQCDLELAEANRVRREQDIGRLEAAWPELQQRYQRQTQQIQQRCVEQWQKLAELWYSGLRRLQSSADEIQGGLADAPAASWLADWNKLSASSWAPATAGPPAIRFGQLRVKMSQIPHGIPRSTALAELTPEDFVLPALVPFPARPSLLLKAQGNGRRVAVEALQAIMLRLLVSVPPGKLRFTIIDPVGLGENFAAFMHLADFNEALVSSRIWTEPKHIEARLADLSEHMENVIQKYLRNEFRTIEQYNRDAGEISEPFRFLVIANFPANFSEAAQRRLLSIATSGARCGVYTLIMVDTQESLPSGISLEELQQHGATLLWKDGRFAWNDDQLGHFEVTLDTPPPAAQVTDLLHAAGRYANEAGRVEVPFEVIAPPPDELWISSTRSGIDVPLGRVGATRLQSLRLGQGTSQHVLVAGKTGSGKSTLLHALITNLALRYSPDEIELYLVDFKQGVEFKTYAAHQLPHARVVAIESDREFGVSVLARLDTELKARAEGFRALGVQDLAAFRLSDANTPMPRILLIVDEFQEFFVEDDRVSQDAALLLDRLVRQGRAFGIHVLLGSQTLAGTYTLARSTIGQMAVRIALQCSEADAHLILSEDNSAARLLSRAGEAIYNDSNGLIEGNHPFQIVWLSDSRREQYLQQVQALAARHALSPQPQVVFEGNLPADPARNTTLAELLTAGRPASSPMAARAWLGEAVAIKDPTAVTFRRQSGGNLLIVGQHDEAALGIFTTALISLSAQHPISATAGARFYIFDGSPANSAQAAALALVAGLAPDPARLVAWRELAAVVNELAVEVERRQKATGAEFPAIYLFVYGLQKLRDLRRQEDDFGFSRSGDDRPPDPARQFSAVLRDGPGVAVHSLVWCDSVNNLNRTWDRQTLREFEMRVAFQMSGNDSSTLIDTPLADKLGMHRAWFHSEEQGVLEKFRPYRWPAESWLDWVRQQLHGTGDHRDSRSQRLAV